MKKNKKKIRLIIGMIAVILMIVVVLILNNNKSELALKCVSEKETNEYFVAQRTTNVYKKGKSILYNDNINVEKLTDNEQINDAIDSYFSFKYGYDETLGNNFLTLNKNENELNLILNINLSKYTSSEVKEFIGTSDTTILGLKSFLEAEGLICEKY